MACYSMVKQPSPETMADIKFYCPECHSKLGVDESVAGFFVNCPDCNAHIQIPRQTMVEPPRVELPGKAARQDLSATQRITAAELAANENIPADLADRIARLEREREEFEMALKIERVRSDTNQGLEAKTADLVQQLESANTRREEAERRTASLEEEKTELLKQTEELGADIQKREKAAKVAAANFEELAAERKTLEARLAKAESTAGKVEDVFEEQERATDKVKELEARSRELKEEKARLEEELKDAGEKISRNVAVTDSLEATKKEAAALAARLVEMETETGALREENTGLTHKAEEAERLVAELTAEKDALREELGNARSTGPAEADVHSPELAAINARLDTAVRDKEALEKKVRDLSQARVEAEKHLQGARDELGKLAREKEKLEGVVEFARKETDAIREKINEAEQRAGDAATLQTRVAQLEEKNAELENALAEARKGERPPQDPSIHEAQLQDTEKELDDAVSQVRTLQSQVSEYGTRDKNAKKEIVRLKKEASSKAWRPGAPTLTRPPKQETPALDASLDDARKEHEVLSGKLEAMGSKRPIPGPPGRMPPVSTPPGAAKPKPGTSIYGSAKRPGTRRKKKKLGLLVAAALLFLLAGGVVWYMRSPAVIGRYGAQLRGLFSRDEVALIPESPEEGSDSAGPAEKLPLEEPQVVDQVRITVTSARIGPVERTDPLGASAKSERLYLVLDMKLENTSSRESIYLLHAWEQSKLIDDLQTVMQPAFRNRFSVDRVVGTLEATELKPGQVVEDRLVFEAPPPEATLFRLVSDPGFWRKTPEGRYLPVSRSQFEVTFSRDDLETPS